MPQLGESAQRRLVNASVLVVGAGGLGCPVLVYLVAAGVGTVGVADDDSVSLSNLQRQVLHRQDAVGMPKVESARQGLAALNGSVTIRTHPLRLTAKTVLSVLSDYDLVIDASDNFETRYLVNDAAVELGIPLVWGAVLRFDGQVSVAWPGLGPCVRCIYPTAPPDGSVPSCDEAGVLGASCGTVGSMQASEAIKIICGVGEPLVGRIALLDGLEHSNGFVTVTADPHCAVCASDAGAVTAEFAEATSQSAPVVETMTALTAYDFVRGVDALVVDVRERYERDVIIDGSLHVPMSEIAAGWVPPPARAVLLYCTAGTRSRQAATALAARVEQAPPSNPPVRLVTLGGGVQAWLDAGLPTETGRQ